MPIDFYHLTASAPCCAVQITAEMLGIELNPKKVDLIAAEQLTPQFLKMNPQHTIPTIDDNGFYLWESRAIIGYLVDMYGKDDSLYPKEAKARAVVNQRLYFDLGTLYQSFIDHYSPVFYGKGTLDSAKLEKLNQALTFLDQFLEGEDYVAGKHLTIADISLVTTVSYFALANHDVSQYKNIGRWLAKMKTEMPYKNIVEGVKACKEHIAKLAKK